ncbi:MAG: hypothetical protein COV41_00905 [Candidatus Brennerbacteria bacterium CG11_big_fil_rev_8_21_14_0_20_43_10]|uniref:PIG-L family deacetylase n=3 Tax=Candidatus Brenneribacteriota TaxID=1817902 RepID=A0A2M8C1M9_9BACT|nr:MAG: hypothetical protein COX12_00990 [Candidatus Brennerbacteria bacterium CG23_combo_of_CG06-09_8_20_14_all_44_41]PIR26576.1 MAG: hypothetical protein COV41_00905 [Candidatus Brennerbacteria bacterium CG11_big_fil_rev_8_21_14_0_20_43_10]PIX28845.1 MAG: hypothetical protein COZ64_01710 [Candidatus Brennerbacteria bacterium CG_4_8_14_3_um_filter_43_14]PJA19499.1 MAG: hypothetical protein COX61_01000 [Candidatus Brennerbacteria bacterium CG_4_10_14_0_2_um_filter_43_14]PJB49964.1 MAG: hypothet
MKTRLREILFQLKLHVRIIGLFLCALALTFLVLGAAFVMLAVFQPQHMQSSEPLDSMPLPSHSDRIMLVVAHPDDEFLSSAGYMMYAKQHGAQVMVVIVTSGEASLIADTISQRRIRLPVRYYIQEGEHREIESLQALHTLGLQNSDIFFLGFPTRGLEYLLLKNWSVNDPYRSHYTKVTIPPFDSVFDQTSNYSGEKLTQDLQRLFEIQNPTIVITHSSYDQNDDHRAVYYLVNKALQQAQAKLPAFLPEQFYFLVHYYQYSFPARANYQYKLLPPLRIDSNSFHWFSFPLTSDEFLFKKQGIMLYKSQFANPYLKLLLNSFVKQNELFYQEPHISRGQ